MMALQRPLQSTTIFSALPTHELSPVLQQRQQRSRAVVSIRKGGVWLNFSRNCCEGGGSLLRRRCSCSGGSRFPVERTGERKGNSSVFLAAAAAADPSSTPDSSPPAADSPSEPPAKEKEDPNSFWNNWRMNAADLRAKVSKWGLAAVLAYGLFDGITYTTFFVLAFLSYEKSTGQNPAANLKALLGVVVLMWGGNNVTRPFRVAGAASAAPFIDRGLKKMQEVLKLPSQLFAFMICVAAFACVCFTVVGLLVLSRLWK